MSNAQSWTEMGMGNGGQVRAVYFRESTPANTGTLYIGSDVAGVWRSNDFNITTPLGTPKLHYEYISNHEIMRFVNKFVLPPFTPRYLLACDSGGIHLIDMDDQTVPMKKIFRIDAGPASTQHLWVSDVFIGMEISHVGTLYTYPMYFTTGNTRVSDKEVPNVKGMAVDDIYYCTITYDANTSATNPITISQPTCSLKVAGDQNDVFSLFVADNGTPILNDDNIFFGSEKGMYRLSCNAAGTVFTIEQAITNDTVTDIIQYDNNNLIYLTHEYYTSDLGVTNDAGLFKYEISTSTKSKINCSFEDGNNNIIPYVNDFISLNKVPGSSSYLLTTENIVTGVNSNQPCGTYKGTFIINNFDINGANVFNPLDVSQGAANQWGWNVAGKPVANPNSVAFTADGHLIIGKSGTTFSTTSPITSTTFNWQQLYTESKNNTAPCSYTSYKNLGFVNSVSKCIYPQDIGGGNFRLWKGEFDRGMYISNDNGESFSRVSNTSTTCESEMDMNDFGTNSACNSAGQFSDCSFIINNYNDGSDVLLYAGLSKGFSTQLGQGNIAIKDATEIWQQMGDTKCGDPQKILFAPKNGSIQNKYALWYEVNTLASNARQTSNRSDR